jgi:hypothetical protein
MAAPIYDIEINQGETFSIGLLFKDASNVAINLTTATILSQIRPSEESNRILAAFTITKDTAVTGRAVLSLTSAQTQQLDFTEAVYDVLLTLASGTKLRAVQGKVTLSKQVTR